MNRRYFTKLVGTVASSWAAWINGGADDTRGTVLRNLLNVASSEPIHRWRQPATPKTILSLDRRR